MNKDQFQTLLDRYIKGMVSHTERNYVEKFYDKLQESEEGWKELGEEKRTKLRLEIYDALQKKKSPVFERETKRGNAFIWRVASMVIISLGLAFMYKNIQNEKPEVTYLTKSTGAGQKFTITLQDGTLVKLNSNSSITYPKQFTENERLISLTGEAYFDVTHDEDRPFTVASHEIQTTVLGTSFNVRAYDPSSVSVALVKGKVMVKANDDSTDFNASAVYLTAGEGAFYDKSSGDIKIGKFNYKALAAWKDGLIYFENASHEVVFDKLENWYGVQFNFENIPYKNWKYSGEFKDMSLELVLNAIEYSYGFTYQIQDNQVKVKFLK